MTPRKILAGIAVALLGFPAQGQEPSSAAPKDPPVDFARDILPVFKENCFSCHGEKKQKGQLRLDSKSLAFQGGTSGKIILPKNGKESRIVTILLEPNADDRMPQKTDPLPKEKVELIRAWIDQGAAWPDAASVEAKLEKHWSYVKPVLRDPPAVKNAWWVRNPVDAFIAAGLEAQNLKPRPEAPKHVLLRRVYVDLIGLPPTREELHAFLADPSPDAYEKVVDRLLADPRHGERWARHWMDVWRYSDWAGYQQEIRDGMRHVWRWRDWIVESVNADKGYDRMIVEMLAGDEIAPDDPDTVRATGFVARNWYKFNRNIWLQNIVEHTAKAFLATTMNCARCHSHFFDPISHQEYYQFRAFFEPHSVRTDHVAGQADLMQDGLARVFDSDPAALTRLFQRGDEKSPDTSRSLPPAVPRVLGGTPPKIEPVPLPKNAVAPEKRDFVIRDLLAAEAKKLDETRAKVDAAVGAIAKQEAILAAEGKTPDEIAKARTALQAALEALPVALLDVPIAEAKLAALRAAIEAERLEDAGEKGEPFRKTAESAQAAQRRLAALEAKKNQIAAQKAVVKARAAADKAVEEKKDEKKRADELAAARKKLAEAEQALAKAEADAKLPATADFTRRKLPAYPATSTGRRTALARWIASEENPLTARVAANQLWMRHFGKPLVPTVFEFGSHGRPPSHPELLDWLAVQLMRGSWSMKKMHRVLVTSSAYRMDSGPDPAALAADPENRLLWRMNSRRAEAEVVRDTVLYVAGQLDFTRGGPDIPYAQGFAVPRRSLYFQHAAEKQMEFLLLFDAANVTECYERTESVVPQQALALANSALVLEKSRVLAARLAKEEDFLTAAFESILGRLPSVPERAECAKFLETQAELFKDPSKLTAFTGAAASKVAPAADPASRAREDLIHVLLNHNDFVTIR